MEKVVKVSSICPEGYELDKEKSTIENLVFKPKKESYEDVYRKLFYNQNICYPSGCGKIENTIGDEDHYLDLNNCTSENQAKKLLAINQLLNVAKYLNDGWEPDWKDPSQSKYYISFYIYEKSFIIASTSLILHSVVYFKTKELARRAIDILGAETIRLTLSTDW